MRWVAGLVVCVIAAWVAVSGPAAAAQASVSGWFHVVWGDPPPGSTMAPVRGYRLIDDQGRWVEILLDESLARPFGGPLALDRKRVRVVGPMGGRPHDRSSAEPIPFVHAQAIELEDSADAAATRSEGKAVTGSQKWATILCRFGDSTDVTPHPVGWFETLMGPVYPGMDHYWRELSYNTIDLTGSVVVGWYNLPQPRSYYVPDSAQLDRLVEDCTAVADADVFFPEFSGLNLMFNEILDCCAWGGGWTLTRDGQTKAYAVTWLPPWAFDNQGIVGHEMGHGLGLPHSFGPTGAASLWDVMSGVGECSVPDPVYGCVGVHTISYHKDILGWIPASRKYVPTLGSIQTITIERLGQPVSGTDYLMAQIPIFGSPTQFYTVEARRFAGYDVEIPGEAIIIHRVDTTLGTPAQVVDADGNDDPNDAGAMWTVGEAFVDSANGITVSVDGATASGFQVTVAFTPATPDLVETVVMDLPATALIGESFSVTDTVQNQGTASAGASTTRYYLSRDTLWHPGDKRLTGSRAVPALGPGETSTGTASVTIPAIKPGAYFVLACADDTKVVPESNETNNCQASATAVEVRAPDLVETAVSSPPATALVGSSFSVTDTVKNRGTAAAGASTSRYYLSLDTVRNTGDTRLTGSRAVPALGPEETSTGTVSVTIPPSTALGTYFLLVCADDLKVVMESNERNNCRASGTPVEVKSVDLVETAVSNPPATAVGGASFAVTDTVQNQGTATAGASTSRYYLSLDTVRNSGDRRLTGSRAVPGLGPGESSTGTVSVTIPSTTVPGTYFLLACADDTKGVPETNEKNNCGASATQVTVGP